MAMIDSAYARLPVPVHELTATVSAPSCVLSGADGQIRQTGMHGLFFSDVRAVAQARLCVGGLEPQPLAELVEGPGATRFVGVARGFGDVMADPTVRVERLRRATATGMTEDITLRSTASMTVRATVSVDVRCDLTPLELAKLGQARPELPAEARANALVWVDGDTMVTAAADGGTVLAAPAQLRWAVELPPQDIITLRWSVSVTEAVPFLRRPARAVEWARPHIDADDHRLARLVSQSLDDLESLRLADPADPDSTFLGAGVPWFLTLFGRDSLWAARMMLPLTTDLAAGTLRVLAARQGRRVDDRSGEAPGKIMHELRHHDVRVAEHLTLPAIYYGSVDATLLWISVLADAWRWGLAEETVASFLPTLDRALAWLDLYGDPDGDGFVEYIDRSGRGLANQGWKDSGDAIRFHDGRLAEAPIALCEVQGYAHRAAVDAAILLDHFGRSGADRWRSYADQLAAQFRDHFWVDGALGPFPALALDGTGAPVDALTSNIGHLLGTGILNPDEERTVARLLNAPALSGAYGLRTMSTLDRAFSALSYHCGAVWPHDTAIALLGLVATGAHAAAAPLIQGLLAAAETFKYRLPENYGGDSRADLNRPLPHPGACRPQAWSAAAAITVLQATLGLTADIPNGHIRIQPMPATLGRIEIRGLHIRGNPFDVTLDRAGRVEVRGLPAGIQLLVPPPQPTGAEYQRGPASESALDPI